jgi:acyl-coenzyme A thioesterase PaaI-like protein
VKPGGPHDTTATTNAAREAAIEASFARQGLMRTLDARIDRIRKGKVILSMPITRPRLSNMVSPMPAPPSP